MRFTLSSTTALKGREITSEGYLRSTATLIRAGVHRFKLSEVRALQAGEHDRFVNVLIPPDLLADTALHASIRGKPITFNHPPLHDLPVNASTWQKYAKGNVGTDVVFTDKFINASILVTDPSVINAIEHQGVEQVSLSYGGAVGEAVGEFDGEAYEFAFTNISDPDHLAVLRNGRGGDTVRINQDPEGGDGMPDDQTTTADTTTQPEPITAESIVQIVNAAISAALEPITAQLQTIQTASQPALTADQQFALAAAASTEPDATDEPEKDAMTPDQVQLAAQSRTTLITMAMPYMGEHAARIHVMDNRQICLTALSLDEKAAGGFTDDFLMGRLAHKAQLRGEADTARMAFMNQSAGSDPNKQDPDEWWSGEAKKMSATEMQRFVNAN